MRFLEKINRGPLSFGDMVASLRDADEISQSALAEMVGISRQNLNDIEKGRTGVGPDTAVKMAKALGYPEKLFLAKAIQQDLRKYGLRYDVQLEEARA